MKYDEMTRGAIWHNPHSFFRYAGWPTVCKDEEGTLYAVCSGFRVGHICPFGKTAMMKSWDDGKTWSIPMVINDTYLDDRDAGIVCLGGKTLLVSWFAHPTKEYQTTYSGAIRDIWAGSHSVLDQYENIPEEHGIGGSFVRLSRDGGMTWGETVHVPVSAPHGPIVLRNGNLLYLGKELYGRGLEEPGAVAAWGSSDQGATWQRLGGVPFPEGTFPHNFHEPHALELPDGTLLGVLRAQGDEVAHGFTVYKTLSKDGGKTWSTPESLGISGSPPHLLQHSSGAIVLTYARREPPFSERAMLSYDGGETWSDEIALHNADSSDIGYPSSVELSDGSILTAYYQHAEGENFPSVLYTKWRI